jgi:hypothetical protein
MTATETPAGARLDLEALADRGPSSTLPCATCGSPTRSHVLVEDTQAWREFDDPAVLDDVDGETTVLFAVVCHTCRGDLSLPVTQQQDRLEVLEILETDGPAVFRAVVA